MRRFPWSVVTRSLAAVVCALIFATLPAFSAEPPAAVQAALQQLASDDPAVRASGADALVALGAPAVPVLLPRLKDPDAECRGEAARILGRIGDKRARAPLVALLKKDPDAYVRWTVVTALALFPDAAVRTAVRGALADQDPQVSAAAARTAGALKDPRALTALTKLLRGTEPEVVVAAGGALAALGTDGARALLDAAGSPEAALRCAGLRGLGRIAAPSDAVKDALTAALKDTDRTVRWTAVEAVSQSPDVTLQRELLLLLISQDWEIANFAYNQVNRIGAPLIPSMIALLVQTPPDQQGMLSGALIQLGDPALDALLGALKDAPVTTRRMLHPVLGRFQGPRALAALTAAAKDDPDLAARCAAIQGFQHRYEPAAMAVLRAALDDHEDAIRLNALQVILHRHDPPAVPALLRALESNVTAVRVLAVQAVARYREARVATALIARLRDPQFEVRSVAVSALSNFGAIAREAVPTLLTMLKDPQSAQPMQVLHTLGMLADARATDAFIDALASPDRDLRQRAIWGLGRVPGEKAASALATLLATTGDLTWSIDDAIRMQGTLALAPLSARLADTDEAVAARAARLLGDIRNRQAIPVLIAALKAEERDAVKTALTTALQAISGQQFDDAAAWEAWWKTQVK